MKLIKVEPSNSKNKKFVATFSIGDDKTKRVHFGHSDYEDFTIHKDETRRDSYRKRHHTGKTAAPDTRLRRVRPGDADLNHFSY